MYVLSGEGLHMNEAYATAVVLLVVVLLMNALSAFVAKKLTKSNRRKLWNRIKLRSRT